MAFFFLWWICLFLILWALLLLLQYVMCTTSTLYLLYTVHVWKCMWYSVSHILYSILFYRWYVQIMTQKWKIYILQQCREMYAWWWCFRSYITYFKNNIYWKKLRFELFVTCVVKHVPHVIFCYYCNNYQLLNYL